MNNQTESTNKEIRGNYCTLDDGSQIPEGVKLCIGDRVYVCKDGRLKPSDEFYIDE